MFSARLGFMRPDSVPDLGGLEPEVVSWRDRVQALEGVTLETDAILVLNDLVVGLKDQGAWDKIIQLLPGSIATTIAGSCLGLVGVDGSPTNMPESIYDRSQGIKIPSGQVTMLLNSNEFITNALKDNLYVGLYMSEPQVVGTPLELPISVDNTSRENRVFEIMHSKSKPSWAPGFAIRWYAPETGSPSQNPPSAVAINSNNVVNSPGWISMSSNTSNQVTTGIANVKNTISFSKSNLTRDFAIKWLSGQEFRNESDPIPTIFTGRANMFMISEYQDYDTIKDLLNTYENQLQGLGLA